THICSFRGRPIITVRRYSLAGLHADLEKRPAHHGAKLPRRAGKHQISRNGRRNRDSQRTDRIHSGRRTRSRNGIYSSDPCRTCCNPKITTDTEPEPRTQTSRTTDGSEARRSESQGRERISREIEG